MIDERLAQLAKAASSATGLLRGDFEAAAPAILEQLAQAARCEWAVYWTLDAPFVRLKALASWSALGPEAARFERAMRARALRMNEGNPGQVWRSGKPIWTSHLVLETGWPRALCAADIGLRGGVWFAVKTDTAIYGVIELLARELPCKTPETLAALERVGSRLGYVIEELRREPSAKDRYPS